jgi:hypothetical protein
VHSLASVSRSRPKTLNDTGRSPDCNRTAWLNPRDTFLSTPANRRVSQVAVIRAGLLDTPTAGSRQLVEQPLCFFEIGGLEAFGKPVVDGREEVAGLGAAPLVTA